MNNLAIILVNPQLGDNIGAIARIMANFDHNDLRIVNPRDGWPNRKAEIVAADGLEVIKKAKIYEKLTDAIADIDNLYAASARVRKMHKEHYNIAEHITEVKDNISMLTEQKIGVMFGSERCGLLNDEIIYAKKIITISTSKKTPVLNLSHAAGLICYEYFNIQNKVKINSKYQKKSLNKIELNYFLDDLKSKLEETDFFKNDARKNKMFQAISNIYTRNNLSGQEVKTLIGITKELYYFKSQGKPKKLK